MTKEIDVENFKPKYVVASLSGDIIRMTLPRKMARAMGINGGEYLKVTLEKDENGLKMCIRKVEE